MASPVNSLDFHHEDENPLDLSASSASSRIRFMLENADSLLFEGHALPDARRPTAANRYYKHHFIVDYWQEIASWAGKFPNIRVRGKAVTGKINDTKEEEGIQIIQAIGKKTNDDVEPEPLSSDDCLSILGRPVIFSPFPGPSEEVLASEGSLEEILAIDNDENAPFSSLENKPGHLPPHAARSSLRNFLLEAPPLSPDRYRRWEEEWKKTGETKELACSALVDEAARILQSLHHQRGPEATAAALADFLSLSCEFPDVSSSASAPFAGPASPSDSEESFSLSRPLDFDENSAFETSDDRGESFSSFSLSTEESFREAPEAAGKLKTPEKMKNRKNSGSGDSGEECESKKAENDFLSIHGNSAVLHRPAASAAFSSPAASPTSSMIPPRPNPRPALTASSSQAALLRTAPPRPALVLGSALLPSFSSSLSPRVFKLPNLTNPQNRGSARPHTVETKTARRTQPGMMAMNSKSQSRMQPTLLAPLSLSLHPLADPRKARVRPGSNEGGNSINNNGQRNLPRNVERPRTSNAPSPAVFQAFVASRAPAALPAAASQPRLVGSLGNLANQRNRKVNYTQDIEGEQQQRAISMMRQQPSLVTPSLRPHRRPGASVGPAGASPSVRIPAILNKKFATL